MPRIIDKMQTYLRELRVEDLQGTRAIRRMQDELLTRVNRVSAPVRVDQVLFMEVLAQ